MTSSGEYVPPVDDENTAGSSQVHTQNYKSRQIGCFWILVMLLAIAYLAQVAFEDYNMIVSGVIMFFIALAQIWTEIEDKGEYLLVTYGPLRWALCGTGKEKIRYSNIKDYEISRTCSYGASLNMFTGAKLFNTCSCCCGGGSCCKHEILRITIKERMQALDAKDDSDCCWERCCFDCFCEKAEYIGSCCFCQPCCNPCNNNCCSMNTIYISTNDMGGVLQLLREKCPDVQYATI